MTSQINSPKTRTKLKIVILGDTHVGKTSMSVRFSENSFKEATQSTQGGSFITHTIETNNSISQFDIWDTAGQERFKALGSLYYKNAKASIVAYDITNYNSFKRAKEWIVELKENVEDNVQISIVGNKQDLDHSRQVFYKEAKEYAESNNQLFYESSAKTGENVKELFQEIMNKIPKEADEEEKIREIDNIDQSSTDKDKSKGGRDTINFGCSSC